MNKQISILGCGVNGLTCGIRLLEEGFINVRIVADKLPPDTTSNIAAAYWYPYKVSPENKVIKWSGFSYNKFMELSRVSGTGVSMTELVKLFDRKEKEPFWKNTVNSFRHANPDELPAGYIDAHISELPVIEIPVYMQFIMDRFRELGGKIEKLQTKITSLEELFSKENIVLNCSGLGSRDICNDHKMYPIRGQLVRTTNPGLKSIISDEEGPRGLCYIVPRSNDCILGA